MTAEFRKIHQFLVFSVRTRRGNTPLPRTWPNRLIGKVCRLSSRPGANCWPKDSRQPVSGCSRAIAYFQLADYSDIRPDLDDVAFARWLTAEHGVASIPVSAFYQRPPAAQKLVRFCFAKQEQTLQAAIDRLQRL